MNTFNSVTNPPKGRPREVLLMTIFGDFYIGIWAYDHFELQNCPILREKMRQRRITVGKFAKWMELDNSEKGCVGLPNGFIPACEPPKHNRKVILMIGPFDYCIGQWDAEERKFKGDWFPEDTALWTHVTGWMELPKISL